MRHIIPISGKDSLATAIVQVAREPGLPYEFIYNDTSAELPDTYVWLDKVEAALGIKIQRIGKSLEQIIKEQGMLPSAGVRFCTKYAKIFPMKEFIGKKEEAVVYVGLRADEPDRKGFKEERNIKQCKPLQEMGINLPLVYRIVGDRGLFPPLFFWERLYNRVVELLGEDAPSIADAPRWLTDRLFAWRSRPNCYFCFYQRQYEWVGLHEFYPDLFAASQRLEDATKDDRSVKGFTWVQDIPLRELISRADAIFERRAQAVAAVYYKRLQGTMFTDEAVDGIDTSLTSCGLFCGK